ncbi:MAG: hypothetical protein HZA54_19170 [Planctomycetes bacterium]|nr:hypothetical protein [Planctomycetota bacterium]
MQKTLGRLVAAKINSAKDPKSFKAHKGEGVPLLLLLDAEGGERVRFEGRPGGDLVDALAIALFNEATPLAKGGKEMEAFERWLPLLEYFPDTAAARQVRAGMEQWGRNPAFKARMAELQAKWFCEPALKRAERVLNDRKQDAKKLEEQRAILEKLAADYGTSPYAAKVQELLAKLPPKPAGK